jgi:hypothetical protein
MAGSLKVSFAAALAVALWTTAQAQPATTPMTGAPVSIRYGSGVSPSGIEGAQIAIERRGCPVTVTNDGPPNRIFVRTRGRAESFTDAGAAAGWAIDRCVKR